MAAKSPRTRFSAPVSTSGRPTAINGEYIELPSYVLVNLRASLTSTHGWSAAVFVNNVTNKHAQLESLFRLNETTTAFNRISTNQPPTAGVDLTYHFN